MESRQPRSQGLSSYRTLELHGTVRWETLGTRMESRVDASGQWSIEKILPNVLFSGEIHSCHCLPSRKKKILEYCRRRRRGTLILVAKTAFVTLKNYVFSLKELVSGAIKCSYHWDSVLSTYADQRPVWFSVSLTLKYRRERHKKRQETSRIF